MYRPRDEFIKSALSDIEKILDEARCLRPSLGYIAVHAELAEAVLRAALRNDAGVPVVPGVPGPEGNE
jgi:hypothetical protein